MMFRTFAALSLAALSAAVVAGQQPTFRTQVEIVEIDAVVTDEQGNPVSGLTMDDFAIREDGRPQAIAAFSTVDIPIERADRPLYSPTQIEPDVQSNQGEQGRVYMIMLDDIHPLLALRTRRFMRRFIEQHMGANDVAAITYLGIGAANSQDFTGSKRVLLNAIERFSGNIPGEAAPSATPAGGSVETSRTEAQLGARGAMRAFRDIAEFMARVPGQRKAILFVSTGQTMTDVANVVDYNGGVMSIGMEDAHLAMQAASRGHVAIYPIDPRGLDAGGGSGEAAESSTQEALQAASTDRLNQSTNLRMIADVTGGFAFINQNTYDAGFTRLVRENSSYYVLGFYSTNDKRDGRFRKVQVTVKRPGLQVRTRSGYLAAKGKAQPAAPVQAYKNLSAATSDALASPIAARGVPLTLFAAPYKGPNRDASVAIVVGIDPAALELAEKDGTFTGEVEIATTAISATRSRTIPGDYYVAKLALKQETIDRARLDGLQMGTAMQLPPGRYQIRAAVGNRSNRAGSVIYDLEVPDFTKAPLVMSGVSVTSASTPRIAGLRLKDPLADVLPGPATSARVFDATETLTLFAEVYDNVKAGAAHTVDLKATLKADDGRDLRSVTEQRSSSELKGSIGGFGFKAELALEGAAPGLYVIHVEARANTGDRPAVSRDVRIRVR
jgi:VWFA-related protein